MQKHERKNEQPKKLSLSGGDGKQNNGFIIFNNFVAIVFNNLPADKIGTAFSPNLLPREKTRQKQKGFLRL